MDVRPIGISARKRRRLLLATLAGLVTYAAYRAWQDNRRIRQGIERSVAALQRCTETAVTRATACVVAGTIQGVAAVRPQAVEAPAPTQPWQAMALEKLVGLLTTRAGMDLVSLAVAVGAQHSTAAFLQHMSSQRGVVPPLPSTPFASAAATALTPSSHGDDLPMNGSPSRHRISNSSSVIAAETRHGNPIIGQLLSWAASREGERFVVAAMAAAARNSTQTYMDNLAGCNTYDDMFAAASRPEHREILQELTVMVTREAVATYLRPPNQPQRTSGGYMSDRSYMTDRSWSDTVQSVSQGTKTLMRQVTTNSRCAAVAIPVLLYASSKGIALGCKDVLSRSRLAEAAVELAPKNVTDSALKLLLLLVSMAVVMFFAVGLGTRMQTLLLPAWSSSI